MFRACRLSTENATDSTSFVWPRKRRVVAPVDRSHKRSVPSQLPLSANWPSELITTSCRKRRQDLVGHVSRYVHWLWNPRQKQQSLDQASLQPECKFTSHKTLWRLLLLRWHLLYPCTSQSFNNLRICLTVYSKSAYELACLDKVRVAAQCAAWEAGLPLSIPVQAPHDHRLVPAASHTCQTNALHSERARALQAPEAASRAHVQWRTISCLVSTISTISSD